MGRRTVWPGQQGLTHLGSTLTTFSEYLMFGELLLSEKQISSMVMAVNLSLKSFSRLYLAERFSLKGEGKLGFFLWNAQVAPMSGSWETLENEASLVQHGGTSSHPLIHSTHTYTHARARASMPLMTGDQLTYSGLDFEILFSTVTFSDVTVASCL